MILKNANLFGEQNMFMRLPGRQGPDPVGNLIHRSLVVVEKAVHQPVAHETLARKRQQRNTPRAFRGGFGGDFIDQGRNQGISTERKRPNQREGKHRGRKCRSHHKGR